MGLALAKRAQHPEHMTHQAVVERNACWRVGSSARGLQSDALNRVRARQQDTHLVWSAVPGCVASWELASLNESRML